MKAFVVRHGIIAYTQGKTTLELANDILPEALPIIKNTASEIARFGIQGMDMRYPIYEA